MQEIRLTTISAIARTQRRSCGQTNPCWGVLSSNRFTSIEIIAVVYNGSICVLSTTHTFTSNFYSSIDIKSGHRSVCIYSNTILSITCAFWLVEVKESSAEGSDGQFVASHDFVVTVVVFCVSFCINVDVVSGVVFVVTDGYWSSDAYSISPLNSSLSSNSGCFSHIELVCAHESHSILTEFGYRCITIHNDSVSVYSQSHVSCACA